MRDLPTGYPRWSFLRSYRLSTSVPVLFDQSAGGSSLFPDGIYFLNKGFHSVLPELLGVMDLLPDELLAEFLVPVGDLDT